MLIFFYNKQEIGGKVRVSSSCISWGSELSMVETCLFDYGVVDLSMLTMSSDNWPDSLIQLHSGQDSLKLAIVIMQLRHLSLHIHCNE